jgi:protein involved in sex pheromone biosynthesis
MTDANTVTKMGLVKSTFHFKKEKLRNADGKVIGDGKKLPSVVLDLPVPTIEFIAHMAENPSQFPKELELMQAALHDQVYRIARSQINDFRDNDANKDMPVTAASLNYDKLDWTAIANMPKGERASTVPSDEELQSFYTSYKEVMPGALNKAPEIIGNHIACFEINFKGMRAKKAMLEKFSDFLDVYAATASADAMEENEDAFNYFKGRVGKLLKADAVEITEDNI